jgi:hypothetical protein
MTEPRRYSEAELHTIFERAARRQENARRAEDAARAGLTLAELQQIGAAAGIDPVHIAAAAGDLAAEPEAVDTLLGLPMEVRASRVLPGTVSDEAWEEMVAELRRHFKDPGTAGQVGRVREWSTTSGKSDHSVVRVTLEPAGEDVRIRIEKSLSQTVKGMYAMAASWLVMGTLFTGLVALKNADAVLLPVLFALLGVLAFAGTQIGVRAYAKHQRPRYESLLDRLELIARPAAPAHPAGTAAEREPDLVATTGTGEARLSLDEDLLDPGEDRVTRNRNRIRS